MSSNVPLTLLRLCMLAGMVFLFVQVVNYSVAARLYIQDRVDALQIAFQNN